MTDLDRKLLAAAERLGHAVRTARRRLATRHRLSLLGVQVLELLADGRPRRVGELAAELDLAPATTSDALAALADRGLLSRRPDPADRRATTVGLSPTGVGLAAEIATELAPLFDREDTPDGARAIALRVLLGEIARLHAAGVITIDRSCLSCRHFQPNADRRPAHCLLLDLPLSDGDLRVDCPEHAAAGA